MSHAAPEDSCWWPRVKTAGRAPRSPAMASVFDLDQAARLEEARKAIAANELSIAEQLATEAAAMGPSTEAGDLLTDIQALRCLNPCGPNFRPCDGCGVQGADFLCCPRCRVAFYCSKKCQLASWKGGHKRACAKWRAEDASLDAALDAEAAGSSPPSLLPRTDEEMRALCTRGDALIRRARMRMDERQLHEAIALLDQALAFVPGYTTAAALKGLLLCMQGKLDEGIASLEAGWLFERRFVAAYGRPLVLPMNSAGLYNLGKAYMLRATVSGPCTRCVRTRNANPITPRHT
jgi:tetratricopeptide (TPR) repeat protein